MTNPPPVPGPGTPSGPEGWPQPPQQAAPQPPPYQAGPAGPPPPQGQQAFQYRPHDPRGSFATGQQAGSFLPPPETFAQRWGIVGKEGRPKQVTWVMQLLWLYLCGAVVLLLFSLLTAGIASMFLSAAGLFNALMFGLVIGAVTVLMIWAVARDELGRFGFDDPRTGLHLGLGFLGLNALCGFMTSFSLLGFIKFLPALLEVATVVLCFIVLAGSPAREWLASRPGNWRRPIPEQRPGNKKESGGEAPDSP